MVVLLLGGRLHVGASLRELILGPRLRVLGLVTVLALLSRWSTGREGRSRKAKRKHGGEYVTHVGLPCCSSQRNRGGAEMVPEKYVAGVYRAGRVGFSSRHSVQTLGPNTRLHVHGLARRDTEQSSLHPAAEKTQK